MTPEGWPKGFVDEARKEAQAMKKEMTLQAHDEIYNQKKELEKEYKEREREAKKREAKILEKEERLEDRQEKATQKESEVLALEKSLTHKERKLLEKEESLDKLIVEQNNKLQEISGLTIEGSQAASYRGHRVQDAPRGRQDDPPDRG